MGPCWQRERWGARVEAGKWVRGSGVRAACVRWLVGRGVSETEGTGDARGVGGEGADVWGRAVGDGACARRRSWSGARV